jgi:predicted DNA-binding transcriptional regulator AlpA
MSYAHMLYTSQAIPIPRIAQTLGMDPTALYTLGEQVIGDWTLPSPETLTDAIQQTTLMHLS